MKKSKNCFNNYKIQNTFWLKLQQFKFDLIYYNLHFERCMFIIKVMNYSLLLICVTALIKNWSTWLTKLCTLISLLTFYFGGISKLLPYEKRKEEIIKMTNGLDPLYVKMEADWRKISNGEMTLIEIEKKLAYYEKQQLKIKNKYFNDDVLPYRTKLEEKASKLTDEYFQIFK
ncbi:MAG: hypothetical protein J5672_01220 [Verrucomicrobia bacterium]|nr:hypothetical protein [Verrucomicrobiota bacterium]